ICFGAKKHQENFKNFQKPLDETEKMWYNINVPMRNNIHVEVMKESEGFFELYGVRFCRHSSVG
ncbi:MAG: hypothetical protein IKV66_00035, partial [Clostridia bacterium]|nr:hypothetical protein [Clostridia bacterium]